MLMYLAFQGTPHSWKYWAVSGALGMPSAYYDYFFVCSFVAAVSSSSGAEVAMHG